MRAVRASVCVLAGFLGAVPALAYQNEPIGFRGINWGTPVEGAIADLTLEHTEGDTTRYSRAGDQMTIGEAKLRSVWYEFAKGRFSSGVVMSEEGSNRAMIAAFRAQFGQGFKRNRFIDDYLWSGAQTNIFLSCSSVRRTCMAQVSSSVLDAEDRADRAKAAAGAGKDF